MGATAAMLITCVYHAEGGRVGLAGPGVLLNDVMKGQSRELRGFARMIRTTDTRLYAE